MPRRGASVADYRIAILSFLDLCLPCIRGRNKLVMFVTQRVPDASASKRGVRSRINWRNVIQICPIKNYNSPIVQT